MIITQEVRYRGAMIDVSKLKPSSEIKVIVRCDVCNEVREAYYKVCKDNQICHKCANGTHRKDIEPNTRFNRLTVLKENGVSKSLCKCDCGNVVTVNNDALKSNTTKSCGCLRKENYSKLGKQIIGKWIGENHPNWKGGISSERQLFNSSKNAKEWRISVFERDAYTCQKCGQIGYKLNAHHIIPFAVNKELRLDLNNGITLCESCHRIEHKINGKPKTTATIQNINDTYQFT